ncbi:hypothetical protein Trydic_g5147 [Trypoxylus dichotomus]
MYTQQDKSNCARLEVCVRNIMILCAGKLDPKFMLDGGKEKDFTDTELEALFHEDSCQTQEELATSLGVTRQAASKHLKAMGMFQKQRNSMAYELKTRDVERRLFACEQLLERQRRKGFLHRFTITPSAENRGDFQTMLPHRRLNRIFTVTRWKRLGAMYYELAKTVSIETLKKRRPQYKERHDKLI